MIHSKGIFHTHLVVKDIRRSMRFYCGLFGMQDTGFKDGDLVFLTTPGTRDLLALNPEGTGGYPGGCAPEVARDADSAVKARFGSGVKTHDVRKAKGVGEAVMHSTNGGEWVSEGMSGAEVFLKGDGAHGGGDEHFAAGFEVAADFNCAWQRIDNEMDSFQSNSWSRSAPPW